MFLEESIKIKQLLSSLVSKGSTLLNVGSGDLRFRTYIQPYVERNVILPLLEAGVKITNLDLYGSEGIDVRLDLRNLSTLKEQYDFVVCSNVFEHYPNHNQLSKDLLSLVKDGGYLLITTPQVFPIHADPIDIGFRPTPEEQLSLFNSAGVDISLIEKGEIFIRAPYESRGYKLPLVFMRILLLLKSLNGFRIGIVHNLRKDLKSVFSTWVVSYVFIKKG